MEQFQTDNLRDLLRLLPVEKPSDGLDARIMERVWQEKTHLEKRGERRTLIWTIALSALVLALGVYALYTFVDWSVFSFSDLVARSPRPVSPPVAPSAEELPAVDYSAYSATFRTLLPFAGIVLLLLFGDSLLRRRVFLRRLRK